MAEEWRAVRCANPRTINTIEALTDRDGMHADTSLEKEEMVRREYFPLNDDGQYSGLPAEGSTPSHIIEQAVE